VLENQMKKKYMEIEDSFNKSPSERWLTKEWNSQLAKAI